MQRALCSLTTFRKATLTMGNTMPTCWGSSERQSSQNGLENYWQGSSPGQRSCTQVCDWLVAMAAVRDCGCKLVDHSPIFSWYGTIWPLSVPQHKKKLGWETISERWWGDNLQLWTFSKIMIASIPRESKRCNTDRRRLWSTGETVLKLKPYLV